MFPSYMHGHLDNIFLFQHYNCSVFNIFTNRHFIVYRCKNIFILNLKISNGGFGYFKVSESTVIIIMKLFHSSYSTLCLQLLYGNILSLMVSQCAKATLARKRDKKSLKLSDLGFSSFGSPGTNMIQSIRGTLNKCNTKNPLKLATSIRNLSFL